jgi:ABC-type transport system substrate-binding protein
VPGLAESWSVSPDNKVYTIKLRPNLTFSDGSPLTAEDVAFTLTVLLTRNMMAIPISPSPILPAARSIKPGKPTASAA